MGLEEKLAGWTGPSSATEQDKQERTERMVREAIDAHDAFDGCTLDVFAKGSYPNNTNVRTDSDVDIAVQCKELAYVEKQTPGSSSSGGAYTGIWTPAKLRAEVVAALKAKFGDQVDTSGSTAIRVTSSTARVDADVVPCFTYRYHFDSGVVREGTRVFRKSNKHFQNYPAQHLTRGQAKNTATAGRFKEAVRILKRVENAMVDAGEHREVPSYFVECLAYNCPTDVFKRSTWTSRIRGILVHIWDNTQGGEPSEGRWLEVNDIKFLFHSSQAWERKDAREFAKAAYNHLGYKS